MYATLDSQFLEYLGYITLTIAKDPILECVHKNIEKCHYTYVTQFTPAQEEGKTGFNVHVIWTAH
jgi:hypothetical protein